MIKTALIVDIDNLYFMTRQKHGKTFHYQNYLAHLDKAGYRVTHKVAFGRQPRAQASEFATALERLGFEMRLGDTEWAIEMALTAARVIDEVECIVLGTSVPQAGRIFVYAKERGKVTVCMASSIPSFFRKLAQCIEIPKEILNEVAQKPKPVGLHSGLDSNVVGDSTIENPAVVGS